MTDDYKEAWMEGDGPVQEAVEEAKKKATDERTKEREEFERAYNESDAK